MSDKRVPSVRLIWLECLVEVVECGSYKGAGAKLDLDPTVVKRNIVQLEKWLGRSLAGYFRKQFIVTEDGREFAPKAKTIIDILYTSRDFIIDKNNSKEMGKHVSAFFAKHMRDVESK